MNYGLVNLTPAVTTLLIANTAVFLLQLVVTAVSGRPLVEDWLALIMRGRPEQPFVWWQVWRLFTYAFLHGSFSHLFFNMLGLFFLGASLEEHLGSARFYRVYFASAVGGAGVALLAAWLGFGGGSLIGASAAVFGVMFCYIALFPNNTIMFWALVLIPVKAKYLGVGLAALQLVSALGAPGGYTSYTAHLGGLAVGLYLGWQGYFLDNLVPKPWRGQSLMQVINTYRRRWKTRGLKVVGADEGRQEWFAADARQNQPGDRHHLTALSGRKPVNQMPAKTAQQEEIDALLLKISQSGMKSLSEAERAKLDAYSQKLRR